MVKLLAVLALLACGVVFPVKADAPVGATPPGCAVAANGHMVCSGQAGTVNGEPVTLTPGNCGYVNGAYACYDSSGNLTQAGGSTTDDKSALTGTGQQATDSPGAATSTGCHWGDISCVASAFAGWLSNLVLYVPRKIFEWFGDAVGNMVKNIPVPQFVTDAKNAMTNLPASVIWLLDLFQVKFGLTVIFEAIAARWLTRFIPFL